MVRRTGIKRDGKKIELQWTGLCGEPWLSTS